MSFWWLPWLDYLSNASIWKHLLISGHPDQSYNNNLNRTKIFNFLQLSGCAGLPRIKIIAIMVRPLHFSSNRVDRFVTWIKKLYLDWNSIPAASQRVTIRRQYHLYCTIASFTVLHWHPMWHNILSPKYNLIPAKFFGYKCRIALKLTNKLPMDRWAYERIYSTYAPLLQSCRYMVCALYDLIIINATLKKLGARSWELKSKHSCFRYWTPSMSFQVHWKNDRAKCALDIYN